MRANSVVIEELEHTRCKRQTELAERHDEIKRLASEVQGMEEKTRASAGGARKLSEIVSAERRCVPRIASTPAATHCVTRAGVLAAHW